MPYANVPMCWKCWRTTGEVDNEGQRAGLDRRPPARLATPVQETCPFCGAETISGIYVRVQIPVTRKSSSSG